ncbi:MAG: hypothetical protein FLDDKLPJ_00158 [Phycisphaerae bacterium]|nr:hypothetical protein [Phycisphaerae bacterium]
MPAGVEVNAVKQHVGPDEEAPASASAHPRQIVSHPDPEAPSSRGAAQTGDKTGFIKTRHAVAPAPDLRSVSPTDPDPCKPPPPARR